MDYGFEREFASAGDDRAAERNWAEFTQFAERSVAAAFLDGTGDTLRQKQPPRNDVAVPSVHDDVDVLVEKVAINDLKLH